MSDEAKLISLISLYDELKGIFQTNKKD